tara:strand:- start:470 stop:841 length:372 start_codon:yes stop_codon:yes gene_type:complete
MKTFEQYLKEGELTDGDVNMLKESLQTEWTVELEEKVDKALEEFVKQYANNDGTFDLERFDYDTTNEGFFGSIFGGLAGFALGKTVGKMIAKVLGIGPKGVMYDMLTSRLVGAALGIALGKKI